MTRLSSNARHWNETRRQAWPIVCQTCYGLEYVIVELYDPATGRPMGVTSVDCFKCKKARKE